MTQIFAVSISVSNYSNLSCMILAECNCTFAFYVASTNFFSLLIRKEWRNALPFGRFNAGVIEGRVRGLITDDAKGATPRHKSTAKTMRRATKLTMIKTGIRKLTLVPNTLIAPYRPYGNLTRVTRTVSLDHESLNCQLCWKPNWLLRPDSGSSAWQLCFPSTSIICTSYGVSPSSRKNPWRRINESIDRSSVRLLERVPQPEIESSLSVSVSIVFVQADPRRPLA